MRLQHPARGVGERRVREQRRVAGLVREFASEGAGAGVQGDTHKHRPVGAGAGAAAAQRKRPARRPSARGGGALLGMKTRGAELRLAEQRTFLRLPAKWLCGDPRRQRRSCTCPSHSRVEGAGKGVRSCTCPSHSRVEGTGEGVRRRLAPGQRPAEQGRKLDPDRGWELLPAPGHPAG